jgi:hypothetical protein
MKSSHENGCSKRRRKGANQRRKAKTSWVAKPKGESRATERKESWRKRLHERKAELDVACVEAKAKCVDGNQQALPEPSPRDVLRQAAIDEEMKMEEKEIAEAKISVIKSKSRGGWRDVTRIGNTFSLLHELSENWTVAMRHRRYLWQALKMFLVFLAVIFLGTTMVDLLTTVFLGTDALTIPYLIGACVWMLVYYARLGYRWWFGWYMAYPEDTHEPTLARNMADKLGCDPYLVAHLKLKARLKQRTSAMLNQLQWEALQWIKEKRPTWDELRVLHEVTQGCYAVLEPSFEEVRTMWAMQYAKSFGDGDRLLSQFVGDVFNHMA